MSYRITGTGTYGKKFAYTVDFDGTSREALFRKIHKECPEKEGSYMLDTLDGERIVDVNERCA